MAEEKSGFIQSFDGLLELLTNQGVFHQSDRPSGSVLIGTERGPLDGEMVIRLQDEEGVLQYIQSLPMEVPPDREAAFCEALARVNHNAVIPGFSYDHKFGGVYYRMAIPLHPEDGVPEDLVGTYFSVTLTVASLYYLALKRVAEEGTSPDTVIDDAEIDVAATETPQA